MTKRVSWNNRSLKLSFTDVRKVHFYSEVLRVLYVELPLGASQRTRSGGCNGPCTARVTRRLHGNEYTRTLKTDGCESGVGDPVLFRRERMDASIVVHGDDFVTLSDDDALREVAHVMSSHHTLEDRAILGCRL